MKFVPMNYHYLRYPLTKFLDKVGRSPFDSIDLYCSAPQLNLFDHPSICWSWMGSCASSSVGRGNDPGKLRLSRQLLHRTGSPGNPACGTISAPSTRQSFWAVPGCRSAPASGILMPHGGGAWNNCRESMAQLAAYAERKHVTLLLEELKNTTTNVLITSRDIARMLDEIDSPAIVGMVDMDQMTYAGETVADYFANLGSRMQYVHFNDRGHTVPGDGDFPMKDYYEQIKAQGYDGCCSFEICDRRYYIDPDKAIDDTVAWMRANTHELD